MAARKLTPRRVLLFTCAGIFVLVQLLVLNAVRPFVPLLGAVVYDVAFARIGTQEPITTADLTGAGPGTLLAANTMPLIANKYEAAGMHGARVVYRSTSGDDGQSTVVSGSVFVPLGAPPEGGWPVISFGHGTIGLENPCAPSVSDNLYGHLKYVTVLIQLGYAVALADFQGLGAKGIHPYTDSKTAGLNMIDAVRALRHTFPDVSDRWVAIGDSQGGGAAWAADEQADRYAPELDMLGAFAASPGPDMSGLVQKAQDGTLTKEQRAVLQAVVESLARLHPELNRDDFRRGGAQRYWNQLNECTPDGAYRRLAALDQLGPRDFTPTTPEAADQLRKFLVQWALPQLPLSAPLYVWYGGRDPFIDAEWTAAAIERACGQGGDITIVFEPEGGHNPPSAEELVTWLADRFAGKPARNDC